MKIHVIYGISIGITTYLLSQAFPDPWYHVYMKYIEYTTNKTLQSIHDDSVEQRKVYPNDIDRNNHMNNARYIYLLNFSRRRLFYALGLWPILQKHGLNLVVKSQMIRHRKELKVWDVYLIRSRVICVSES